MPDNENEYGWLDRLPRPLMSAARSRQGGACAS